MDGCAPEAKRSLRLYGIDVRSDETSRFATSEDPGRSDLTLILRGKGAFVEVKDGGSAWVHKYKNPDKGWTSQQREWARRAVSRNGSDVWIWVSVGTHPVHYSPLKYKPRRTFLIPFSKAIEVVELVEANGMNSIPYSLGKGSRKFYKVNGISMIQQFSEYALAWGGNETWTIPESHEFSAWLK